MNVQQQIREIEKHIFNPNLHPDLLFEMNRKYRELKDKKDID